MRRLMMGAFVAVGLLTIPMWAEEARQLTAEVPFAFHAGDAWMPPGEYALGNIFQGVMTVRSPDAIDTAIVMVHRSIYQKPKNEAYLVFNKYEGERYFLAQIWLPGETNGRQLIKSRRERELVTSVLRSEARRPEQVVVLARLIR